MWTSLPLPIRLSVLGLGAIVALVTGAVALRVPPYDALEADEAEQLAPSPSGRGAPHAGAPALARSAFVAAASAGRGSPAEIAPVPDARDARAQLRRAMGLGRFADASAALDQLLQLDPKAADDGEVRADIVELSMRIMLVTGPEAGRVFDMISTRMGTTGIDILYELMTTRGGSRAAARAEELLRDDAVRARGTPALRIAYDLRKAKECDDKKALFARAGTEGDGRTLGQLQLLYRRCGRQAGLQNDPDLRAAMDAIKARSN